MTKGIESRGMQEVAVDFGLQAVQEVAVDRGRPSGGEEAKPESANQKNEFYDT